MDFDSIFGGPQDGDTPPAVIPPEVPEPAPAAVAPQTPPVVAQPSVQTPTSPQAPTSPAPTQPTGAEAPNLDPTDPLAISRALEANFDVAVDHVAKTLFQLSKEDVEALEADTVGAIPKLLARSMVKSQVNMLQQLGQIVPKMIARQVEALRMNSQNEGKFYQRWPQLKEKGELVRRLAATYRQMNPAARLDTMIEELGPIIMMAAKLPMVAPGQPQNPMAPAAQPTNGIRQPQPSPFVPAMGGPGSPQTAQELSDIEAMFMGEQ